jgi:hypothetical protein
MVVSTPVIGWAQADADRASFKSDIGDVVLSAYWKKINPEQIIKEREANPNSYPVTFNDLGLVVKNSQAEKLGLTIHCKVSKTPSDEGANGKIHWVDRDGKAHVSEVEPGAIGISYFPGFDVTAWYLNHGQRDAKWDATVVTALQSQSKDAKLADAFWHKVMELGYKPDPLSKISGLIIAMSRQDIPRAIAFAEAIGPLKDIPANLVDMQDWYRLAAVTGNPDWLNQAVDACKITQPDPVMALRARQLMEAQKGFSKENECKNLKPPSELAKTMKRTSFLGDAVIDSSWVFEKHPVNYGNEDDWLARIFAQAHVANTKNQRFVPHGNSAMPDHRFNAWIGPKKRARDMDISMTVEFLPLNDNRDRSKFHRHAMMALTTRSSNQQSEGIPWDTQVIGFCINYLSLYETDKSNLAVIAPSKQKLNYFMLMDNPITEANYNVASLKHSPSPLRPQFPILRGQDFKIRMVRVGTQAELFLNGHRIALVHVPLDRTDIGLGMFVCGTQITFETLDYADVLE